VTVRTSGQGALDLFVKTPDEFDIIITDQNMPNMTGLELARNLLSIRPETPMLLVTGDNDILDEETVRSSGIFTVLGKPLDEVNLIVAMSRAVKNNNCYQI
jgi:CheY-like chemotaxis protein